MSVTPSVFRLTLSHFPPLAMPPPVPLPFSPQPPLAPNPLLAPPHNPAPHVPPPLVDSVSRASGCDHRHTRLLAGPDDWTTQYIAAEKEGGEVSGGRQSLGGRS